MPVIVIKAPTAPDVGDRPVILGAETTVNDTPVLATLFTVITTLPVVAPGGTGTAIEVVLQEVGVAGVPLKVIVLDP